jgi:hypothetical protein
MDRIELMKNIVAILRPFDMDQTLIVYEDGNKIDMAQVSVDDFNKVMFSMADQYEIDSADLVGPKRYAEGIKNQALAYSASQYACRPLNIRII